MNNIMVVGDIHGNWGPLNKLINKKQPSIILQCGDFGWWPAMTVRDNTIYHLKGWNHKGIKPKGTKVYWCDGNHEDHWNLERLSIDAEGSGLEVYENVFYQPRGSTLTLPDGRVVLFIGGADSIDKGHRTIGIDWFPEELISQGNLDAALSLETPVDIVISHTAPNEWIPDVCRGSKLNDPSRVALSMILEKYKPSLWYHGHWHRHAEGTYGNTKWFSLDYPGHGGRWWTDLL